MKRIIINWYIIELLNWATKSKPSANSDEFKCNRLDLAVMCSKMFSENDCTGQPFARLPVNLPFVVDNFSLNKCWFNLFFLENDKTSYYTFKDEILL